MRALIVEDESLVAKDLMKLIGEVAPDVEVVMVLASVQEAVHWLHTHTQPDLMFLDIQLNDGTSFDIFEQVQVQGAVIFTTAYDDYAIRAFKVNSIDYLLKPIDKQELKLAIQKLERARGKNHVDVRAQIQSFLAEFIHSKTAPSYKERFLAHQGKMNVVVLQQNIACIQKDTLIYFITNDKQQLIADFETMDELEELLNPAVFYRANRQTYLNIQAVESYRTDSYGKLVVKLKSPVNLLVDISREKAPGFKHWLAS